MTLVPKRSSLYYWFPAQAEGLCWIVKTSWVWPIAWVSSLAFLRFQLETQRRERMIGVCVCVGGEGMGKSEREKDVDVRESNSPANISG